MRDGRIRVMLAGSNERMRHKVREAVEALSEAVLVGEVARGEQAISGAMELQPDVVVMDVEICGVHAIEVTRAILRLHRRVGIVAWIDLDERSDLPDEKTSWMRHFGVHGCLDSDAERPEIEQAIASVAKGEAFISFRLAQRATLSPREREILTLIAAGWTNTRIAKERKITPSTVSSHIVRICRKVGIGGRAEAVARGRALGLGRDIDETTDLDSYYAGNRAKRDEFYRALSAARQIDRSDNDAAEATMPPHE
jgi:DNA-binding NarL/FixJ family response regulator